MELEIGSKGYWAVYFVLQTGRLEDRQEYPYTLYLGRLTVLVTGS